MQLLNNDVLGLICQFADLRDCPSLAQVCTAFRDIAQARLYHTVDTVFKYGYSPAIGQIHRQQRDWCTVAHPARESQLLQLCVCNLNIGKAIRCLIIGSTSSDGPWLPSLLSFTPLVDKVVIVEDRDSSLMHIDTLKKLRCAFEMHKFSILEIDHSWGDEAILNLIPKRPLRSLRLCQTQCGDESSWRQNYRSISSSRESAQVRTLLIENFERPGNSRWELSSTFLAALNDVLQSVTELYFLWRPVLRPSNALQALLDGASTNLATLHVAGTTWMTPASLCLPAEVQNVTMSLKFQPFHPLPSSIKAPALTISVMTWLSQPPSNLGDLVEWSAAAPIPPISRLVLRRGYLDHSVCDAFLADPMFTRLAEVCALHTIQLDFDSAAEGPACICSDA